MTTKQLIIFAVITVLNNAYAQDATVGDSCTVRATGAPGTCKISRDCPEVEEQAKRGVTPTICAKIHYTVPIVCCENSFFPRPDENGGNTGFHTGGSGFHHEHSHGNGGFDSRPDFNENSGSNFNRNPSTGSLPNLGFIPSSSEDPDYSNNADGFVYPSDNGQSSSANRRRISEEKCEEYNKAVTGTVSVLPLVTNSRPMSYDIQKCVFNGVGLIVGGQKAAPKEFPYMVAVGFYINGQPDFKCGGTLISDRFVLTAAHCTYARDAPDGPKVLRMGDLNLTSSNDGSEHADYEVDSIIVHPNYKFPEKYNDIALLRTSRTIRFTDFVRPACLYSKGNLPKKEAIATGWGKTDLTSENSEVLMKVSLDILDRDLCRHTYPVHPRQLPRGIISSMLCVGKLKGGMDTCQGDSGGPLMITESDNHCKFYVIAVTSFGKICGVKNIPAIYTKVSDYISWIEDNVW